SRTLGDQRSKIDKNFDVYEKMADSVFDFRDKLISADVKGIVALLREAWEQKKSLSSAISSPLIETMYAVGLDAGAWAGKLLGAGQGGCLFFIAPQNRHQAIVKRLEEI